MFGFSKRKKLLALGCSWTDKNYRTVLEKGIDVSFDKWPAIVGQELDLEVENLGVSGTGNERILNRLEDYLFKHHKDIDVVMILWSQQHRVNVLDNYSWNIVVKSWKNLIHEDLKNTKELQGMVKDNEAYHLVSRHENGNLVEDAYRKLPTMFMRNVYRAQQICDRYNITLIQMSGVLPISSYVFSKQQIDRAGIPKGGREDNFKHYLQLFLESEYFDWIEDNTNFIGWPIHVELGGYSGDDGLFTDQKEKGRESKFRISEKDLHPNSEGQRVIANEFIQAFKKIN